MGGPRPSYGRARNYGTQGRNEYGRLGGLGIGPNYVNSHTNPNPNLIHNPKTLTLTFILTLSLTLALKQKQWHSSKMVGTPAAVPRSGEYYDFCRPL